MPSAPPRIASCCGVKVAHGDRCPCQRRRDAARKASHDRRRRARDRGYAGRGRKARAAFLALFPKCARCPAPASVVDHIRPHKGDPILFWDKSNWQPLCAKCHNGPKQSQEKRRCEAA